MEIMMEIGTENKLDLEKGRKRLANNNDGDNLIAIKQSKLENVPEKDVNAINESQPNISKKFEQPPTTKTKTAGAASSKTPRIPQSPKKRLELPTKNEKRKERFIYGNYSQYYGYRNKDFQDVRLDAFETRRELFENKKILDIGCNNGFITAAIAKRFNVMSIAGIDIDRSLVNQAIKNLVKVKKSLPMNNEARKLGRFPFNVQYVHGNYVLKNDVLLEIERAQFDVILCLSITKWIQLNFGDSGLKQCFRRMFLQLQCGGILILEAQPIKNYRKRKYVSEEARINFKEMKFFPEQFTEYLLSEEIGFKRTELLCVPEHCAEGFKRPMQLFFKD